MFASSKPVAIQKDHLNKYEKFKYEPKSLRGLYSSCSGNGSLSGVGTISGTPRILVSEEESSPVDIKPFDVNDFFANPSSPVPSSRILAFGSNYRSSAIAQSAPLPFQVRKMSLSDKEIDNKANTVRKDLALQFTGFMLPEEVVQLLKKNDIYEQYDQKTFDELVWKISYESQNIEGMASVIFETLKKMPNFAFRSTDDPLAKERYLRNFLWAKNPLQQYISNELSDKILLKFQKQIEKANYSAQESEVEKHFDKKVLIKKFKESTLAYRKRISLNVAEHVKLRNQLLRPDQKLSEREQKSIIDHTVSYLINKEYNRQKKIEEFSCDYFNKRLMDKDISISTVDFLRSLKNERQQIIDQGVDPDVFVGKIEECENRRKILALCKQDEFRSQQELTRQSTRDQMQAAMHGREKALFGNN